MLWIDGAIHGDEPEGPLCCQILLREVKPRHCPAPRAGPRHQRAAYEAACRGNPLDTFSHDMNRIYPGRAERLSLRAHRLGALGMDAQGGRYGDFDPLRRRAFLLARSDVRRTSGRNGRAGTADGSGLGLIMSSPNPNGSPMAVMAEGARSGSRSNRRPLHDSPRAFAEVGRMLADAVLNVLRHYKMLPGEASTIRTAPRARRRRCWRRHSGLFLAGAWHQVSPPR